MKSIFHSAESRGNADHGWLKAKHSFSFASYHNRERMHFGVLRVLNDDVVAPGMGFGTHPHDNMEIITIPLEGALEHKDSMGTSSVIRAGEIQMMSAGTGIQHSEFNHEKDKAINLLQIWIFPNKRDVTPRYDQQTIDETKLVNNWSQLLSPSPDDDGIWVHQNAWFHMGKFDATQRSNYTLKDPNNGVYVFVIEGEVSVEGQQLNKRDALGVWETTSISFDFKQESKVLLIEVPMDINK